MTEKISANEVAYVADLARLALSDDETEHFAHQLSAVLEHIDAVAALDLEGVPPTSHPFELENVLRADTPETCLDRAEVLAEAPAAEDGRFRVPPILGEAP